MPEADAATLEQKLDAVLAGHCQGWAPMAALVVGAPVAVSVPLALGWIPPLAATAAVGGLTAAAGWWAWTCRSRRGRRFQALQRALEDEGLTSELRRVAAELPPIEARDLGRRLGDLCSRRSIGLPMIAPRLEFSQEQLYEGFLEPLHHVDDTARVMAWLGALAEAEPVRTGLHQAALERDRVIGTAEG